MGENEKQKKKKERKSEREKEKKEKRRKKKKESAKKKLMRATLDCVLFCAYLSSYRVMFLDCICMMTGSLLILIFTGLHGQTFL